MGGHRGLDSGQGTQKPGAIYVFTVPAVLGEWIWSPEAVRDQHSEPAAEVRDHVRWRPPASGVHPVPVGDFLGPRGAHTRGDTIVSVSFEHT